MTVLVAVLLVVVGFVVGVLSALFGVGGGVVIVPFLVFALELTQHDAEGTSLLVIVPTAIAGTIAHYRRGYVVASTAVQVAAGGIVGAVLGALIGLELSGPVLRKLFAVLVAIVGARLIHDGLVARRKTS